MDYPVKITLIANAGLKIEYRGTVILIDSMFVRGEERFSQLPEGTWEKMRDGEPPFEKVDYLIFTHYHPDHFSPLLTMDFLDHRDVKNLFITEDEGGSLYQLKTYLKYTGKPHVIVRKDELRLLYKLNDHITVRPIPTRHIDKMYNHVPHTVYLISFDDKDILFTADMDYTYETLDQLDGDRLRAVFVNPLFFRALQTGKFFKGDLNTDLICVYHVPFPGDDKTGLIKVLDRDVKRTNPKGTPFVTLREAWQEIDL